MNLSLFCPGLLVWTGLAMVSAVYMAGLGISEIMEPVHCMRLSASRGGLGDWVWVGEKGPSSWGKVWGGL